MAEIHTRPLEPVQEALNLFERRSDQSSNEMDVLTKELASCRAQLEAREEETKQADLMLEALHEAMQEMSEKYGRACEDAYGRMAELEAGSARMAAQQSEAAGECSALRRELAAAKGELAGVKASSAAVLRDVEAMDARMASEREGARAALARIMELNESVLSSAVAAIKAEEERSVFFQEITLEFFNSDKNLEVIRRQVEMIEAMEKELLAKTMDIDYLQSELKQARELYMLAPQEDSDKAGGAVSDCAEANGPASEAATVGDQNLQGEFAFHPPGAFAVTDQTLREDHQVAGIDRDRQEDDVDGGIDSGEAEKKSGDQGQEQATAENSMGCKGVSDQHVDVSFASDSPVEAYETTRFDGIDGFENEVKNQEQRGEVQEFAEDRGSIEREDGNINSAVPEIVMEGQEEPEMAEACFATEIVRENFKDDGGGGGQFYTKEIGLDSKLDEGYAPVVKAAAEHDGGALKEKLDAAHTEISDLRFSLEEAVRRAELAEEAKAALQRELREEIQRKRSAAPPPEDARPASAGTPVTPLARLRPTPGKPRSAGRGEESPLAGCLTLGKVLNMKYK